MNRKLGPVLIAVWLLVSLSTLSFGAKSDTDREVLSTIYFNSGSAEINPESETDLLKVQAALKADLTIGLQIEGYTDNRGSEHSNREISQKRVKAVQEWFLKQSVDPTRLMVKNYGGSRPSAKRNTSKGRSLNRRVDIVKVFLKLPSAYLPATRYEFTPVAEGQEVTHDFVIQNKGSALLEVQKVNTD